MDLHLRLLPLPHSTRSAHSPALTWVHVAHAVALWTPCHGLVKRKALLSALHMPGVGRNVFVPRVLWQLLGN